MTTILVGDCQSSNLYQLWDADAALETEFEYIVAKALMCVYPDYLCFPFGGSFKLEDTISRPDLALVAKDLSHWFVIEVELTTHSLDGHVLPQVRNFRYGQPQQDCIATLASRLGKDPGQIQTFLKLVPRTVAVIANKRHREWEIALKSLQVQFVTVSVFNSPSGVQAVEVDGRLVAQQEHLGFGQYFATDRSLRFHRGIPVPAGQVMLDDLASVGSMWTVTRDDNFAWFTKTDGTPDIPNGCFLQLLRAFGGRFFVRLNEQVS